MPRASPPPSMPRCSALSRSFLPGQSLRSGGTWQLSESTDRQDQPNRSVHAFRGTPIHEGHRLWPGIQSWAEELRAFFRPYRTPAH